MRVRIFSLLILACAVAALAPAATGEPDYVQAVEFPYYLYPRHLWERELVWLNTIGIRTVEFSIPWNWHEPEPGKFDFTGETSPRRDLLGFIRVLRRLGMRAWIRPLAPVKGWINGGVPAWAARDRRAQRQWTVELEKVLAPRLERHGGPIAFVEGALPWTDPGSFAPAPPLPVRAISANDAGALARSRQALAAGKGSLLWEDVEDALYPAGWEAPGTPVFRQGAVSLNGDERSSVSALRRGAALLKSWAALITPLAAEPAPVKLPPGVSATELLARTPGSTSALSVTNTSTSAFTGELRVHDSAGKRSLQLPALDLAPGGALWLPVWMPLASGGLCKDCSQFAHGEQIVYATAELNAVEFENGILAMEFSAPKRGEVVLQLSRQPSGPLLAGGKPTDFDWDEKTLRARLPVPAGDGPGSRVRIGLAIEAPDVSAFFVNATRLVLGRANTVSTQYSSPEIAARSRLRLPEGFTAKPTVKSPNEIDYAIDVPADALHGSWANLGIEADGILLGRARLQLFRPVSVRLASAVKLHFGTESELQVEPLVVALDPKAGRNLDVTIRNNAPQIQNFVLEAGGDGWEFLPARTEISIGAVMERVVSLRALGQETASGLSNARLRISGGARMEIPLRIVAVPRGQTAAYSLDLDGDGVPEWVLESDRARAVFSTQDGGRWREFVFKDTGTNFLPEQGAFAGAGAVEVRPIDSGIEITAAGCTRTARLKGAALIVEQNTPLAGDGLHETKRDGVTFEVARESARRVVYTLIPDEHK